MVVQSDARKVAQIASMNTLYIGAEGVKSINQLVVVACFSGQYHIRHHKTFF